MDMIGHDAPSMDATALTIEEQYSLFNDTANLRLRKEGFAEALVEIVFETLSRLQAGLIFRKLRQLCQTFFNDGSR